MRGWQAARTKDMRDRTGNKASPKAPMGALGIGERVWSSYLASWQLDDRFKGELHMPSPG